MQAGGCRLAYRQAGIAFGGIGHGLLGHCSLWWAVAATGNAVEQRACDVRLGALVLAAAAAAGRRVSGGLDGGIRRLPLPLRAGRKAGRHGERGCMEMWYVEVSPKRGGSRVVIGRRDGGHLLAICPSCSLDRSLIQSQEEHVPCALLPARWAVETHLSSWEAIVGGDQCDVCGLPVSINQMSDICLLAMQASR